jgi:hypothetical protein
MAEETTDQNLMPETRSVLGLDQSDVFKKITGAREKATEAEMGLAEKKGQADIAAAREKANLAQKQASELSGMYGQYKKQLMTPPPKREIEPQTKEGMMGLAALLPVAGAFFGGKGLTSATGAMQAMTGLVKGYQEGNKERIAFEQKKYDDAMKEFERHQGQIKEAFNVAMKAAQVNQNAAQSALEIKLAELNAPLLKESVKVNGITKGYQDFIEVEKNTMKQISQFQSKFLLKFMETTQGAGPKSELGRMIGAEAAAATPDKAAEKIVGGVKSVKSTLELIDRAKDPDIQFGELSRIGQNIEAALARNIGTDGTKDLSPQGVAKSIDEAAAEAGLSPNDKNITFYKEAVFTALELERQARGGSILPVAVMKTLTPLLDPRTTTREQYVEILRRRANDVARGTGLTEQQLGRALQATPRIELPAGTSNVPKTVNVSSEAEAEKLPSGTKFVLPDGRSGTVQ